MALPSPKDPDYWDEEVQFHVERSMTGGNTGWQRMLMHKTLTELQAQHEAASLKNNNVFPGASYRVVAKQTSVRVVARY
jgi:hypothetical protein